MMGWIVFVYLAGMMLILAEFFVPGLICGIIGIVLVLASCVLAAVYHPANLFLILLGEFVGAVVFILAGLYLIPRTRAGKTLILDASQKADSGWVAMPSDKTLIGQTGSVYTALRPAGSIMVDGRRLDAVSDGDFIDRGRPVRILEVHGNRVVVEEVRQE